MDGHVAFIDNNISFGNGGLTEGQIINNQNPPAYDANRLGIYQRLGIRNDEMPVDLGGS